MEAGWPEPVSSLALGQASGVAAFVCLFSGGSGYEIQISTISLIIC